LRNDFGRNVRKRKKTHGDGRGAPRLRADWPSGWVAGGVLILVFCIAAILHVRSRLAVVQLGYRLSQATKEHEQLQADHRKLQVEVATLRSPRRLRKLATERLDLREPAPQQIVHAGD
jgi:cell division protein FtsL